MKRYLITESLRNSVKNNPLGINQLSRLAGFDVKKIYNLNKGISETHLNKLKSLLHINPNLEEYRQDYAANLGKYAHNSYNLKTLELGEDLAEFCGIMLGDGNMNRRGVRIAFDKRNVNYMAYVNKLFEKLVGLQLRPFLVKATNQGYLYFYSAHLVEHLTSVGLVAGDKIKNNVGIPDWIKENEIYSKRCIRGLIDTDGCIYICKRERQKYVKFTNFNRKLLLEFKDLALKSGYHFASANQKNVCLYRKDEVIRFINDIKPVRAGVVI